MKMETGMNQPSFAVSILKLSKMYRLWRSPQDRLLVPLKRLFKSILQTKELAHCDGFKEFYALKDISLTIQKGESWGFVGVNGSGKSTLLKIISGNIRPSSGRVEVDGKVVILDYGSGFNGEFTGKENIYIKATLLGLTKKQINERFDAIVDFAEIGDFINQPVKTYSSGMMARLGFAIIAHVDADIIITDEALAVGDVFFVQKCMRFIREFLKRGTFLFVSHSTNDVLSLCQHAVWLEHGVCKAMGPAAEVVQAYLDKTHLDSVKEMVIDEISANTLTVTNEIVKSEVKLDQAVLSQLMDYQAPEIAKDSRWDFVNHSSVRNDIEVNSCELKESIGTGGACITRVMLCNAQAEMLSWCVGGEVVLLSIEIKAENELKSPLIGFQVIDHLGQVLFADTSAFLIQSQPILIKKNTVFVTEFKFQMPMMPVGKYTVRVAVALGEHDGSAILLQTIDKAMILHSIESYVTEGLIGVPMKSVHSVGEFNKFNKPMRVECVNSHPNVSID